MRVNIGNRVYNVEFVTLAERPEYGDKSKPLVKTECSIRTPKKTVIAKGSATQNYRDPLSWEEGRKFALTRAITGFSKVNRSIFWDKYKQEYPIKG